MRIRFGVMGILIFLCAAFTPPLCDPAHAASNERFEYDLHWGIIKVGTAVLEVQDNRDTIRISAKAWSSGFISTFYPVEDIIVSTVRKNSSAGAESPAFLPFNYRVKLREGRHRRDKEVVFDAQSGRITFSDYRNNERVGFPFNEAVRDPLSGFFYVRRLPLEIGKSVYVEVFESKKHYTAEVKILRKESVATTLGTRQALVIRPLVRSEGIFVNKGDIYIWLTDNEKRIPVLVRAKVPIGSVTATLRTAAF